MWESTVEHARECVLDDKLYSYCSGHGIILLFNCIHEIIGVVVGSNCFSVNALTATQKVVKTSDNTSFRTEASLSHEQCVDRS